MRLLLYIKSAPNLHVKTQFETGRVLRDMQSMQRSVITVAVQDEAACVWASVQRVLTVQIQTKFVYQFYLSWCLFVCFFFVLFFCFFVFVFIFFLFFFVVVVAYCFMFLSSLASYILILIILIGVNRQISAPLLSRHRHR